MYALAVGQRYSGLGRARAIVVCGGWVLSKRPSFFVWWLYETVQESDEPLCVRNAITKLELSVRLVRAPSGKRTYIDSSLFCSANALVL